MTPLPRSISRRGFLIGAAAAGVLTACGSGDDDSGSGSGDSDSGAADSTPAGGSPEDGAALAFGTWNLAQRFPQNVQEPGLQRLPISLATADGRLVADGPDSLAASVTDADGSPLGVTITAERRDVEPGPYYGFRVPIDTPGIYYLVVDGGPEQGAAFQVMEPGTVVVPTPGSSMPSFDTPTMDDPRGVDPVCTRAPEPCPFHDVTLTEALAGDLPVVYLVGTPAFCSTGTCAPALESMIDIQDEYGDRFTWVHAEVFTDDTATTPTDAVDAVNLTYEPALFVVGADGEVIERLDAVWDRTELVEVLERATA